MKSIKLVLATAALAVSGAAIAGPSYTYVDAGIIVGNSDSSDQETEGFSLRGSFGFADIFHVGADIASVENNGGKSKSGSDDTGYALYFGVNPAVTENIDLVARIGYASREQDSGNAPKPEQTGAYLQVGPRGMIGEKVELSAYGVIATGENKKADGSKDDFRRVGYAVGGQYYFTPAISLGADITVTGSQSNAANLFVRFSFGNN
jgi:hypothetical protein